MKLCVGKMAGFGGSILYPFVGIPNFLSKNLGFLAPPGFVKTPFQAREIDLLVGLPNKSFPKPGVKFPFQNFLVPSCKDRTTKNIKKTSLVIMLKII